MTKLYQTTSLADIGKVLMCKRVLKKQTSSIGEIPFFKISTFGEKADSFISKELFDSYREKYPYPKKGEILISAAGTVGKTVVFNGQSAYFQDSNIVWISNDESKLLNSYLYYFYQTKPWLTTKGSTIKRIYNDNLRSIKIGYPNILNQQKISSVLSVLDSKIELNNRINAELEVMAKTLYDYWFVQFDFPNKDGKPYKTSGGKMTWNSKLKKEIPAEWSGSNILAVADLLGGGTPTKKKLEYWSGSIPFFTPTDADGTIFKFTTEDYITEEGLRNSSTKLFEENTVFITARGSVGKLILAGTKMAMNQSCYALRAKTGISYTFLFFLTKELIHHLEVKSSGSVFDSIVSNDIEFTNLAIPDAKLVKSFAQIAESAFESIANNTRENRKLSELRDWLLPMLMNGQVSVK